MDKVEIMRFTGKPPGTKHNTIWNVNAGDLIQEIFEAIHDGIKAAGDIPVMNTTNPKPGTCSPTEKYVVMFGYGRRADPTPKHWLQNWRNHIITEQKRKNGYTFCWDGGFFKSLNNFKYYRFSLNSPLSDGIFLNKNSTSERWNKIQKEFNVPFNSYFNQGNKILICTQPDAGFSMNLMDTVKLMSKWVQRIQNTVLPIFIKPHPNTKKYDIERFKEFTNNYKNVFLIENIVTPLYDVLKETKIMLTYNSTVAVESALYGIQTYTFDSLCHAYNVTEHDLQTLLTPRKFNREQWVNDLCNCMWSAKELRTGELWSRYKEYLK